MCTLVSVGAARVSVKDYHETKDFHAMLDETAADILDLTAKIIEAHLSHNPVAA